MSLTLKYVKLWLLNLPFMRILTVSLKVECLELTCHRGIVTRVFGKISVRWRGMMKLECYSQPETIVKRKPLGNK